MPTNERRFNKTLGSSIRDSQLSPTSPSKLEVAVCAVLIKYSYDDILHVRKLMHIPKFRKLIVTIAFSVCTSFNFISKLCMVSLTTVANSLLFSLITERYVISKDLLTKKTANVLLDDH